MSEKPILVLMDFDGTITKNDTLIELIRFHLPWYKQILGALWISPIIVLFKTGLIPNWKGKEALLSLAFGGMKKKDFIELCKDFVKSEKILIRKQALEQMITFTEAGNHIYIVTASSHYWVKAWIDLYPNIEAKVISTDFEVKEDKITGRIAGQNCYGNQKVSRVREIVKLTDYSKIIAYGDSNGDREMLAFADEGHYRPFR